MRIVLIGPTYPFRGGIAHYTTLLCRALRMSHEVMFVSFKRQYPGFFFPGKTDRDTSKIPLRVDDVDYIIDSLNPLTWVAASRLIEKFRPEKLVLPWWVTFWTPQFWTILKIVKRRIGCEVVFICHNVVDHESNFLKAFFSRIVLKEGNRLITHSEEETRRIKSLLGNGVDAVTAFHPAYTSLNEGRFTKERAKELLGIKGDLLLFFGFVRSYKGLSVLLDAMPLVLKDKQVTLLIAGEFWDDKRIYLKQIERCGIRPYVRIHDEYVSNEKIGIYFGAADLVVQPYISASASGVCQIAYGFDRPVVGTTVGNLPDIVEDGVNGRLVAPGNPEELARAIVASLEPGTLYALTLNAARTKERFSWEEMARIVSGARIEVHAGAKFHG